MTEGSFLPFTPSPLLPDSPSPFLPVCVPKRPARGGVVKEFAKCGDLTVDNDKDMHPVGFPAASGGFDNGNLTAEDDNLVFVGHKLARFKNLDRFVFAEALKKL